MNRPVFPRRLQVQKIRIHKLLGMLQGIIKSIPFRALLMGLRRIMWVERNWLEKTLILILLAQVLAYIIRWVVRPLLIGVHNHLRDLSTLVDKVSKWIAAAYLGFPEWIVQIKFMKPKSPDSDGGGPNG